MDVAQQIVQYARMAREEDVLQRSITVGLTVHRKNGDFSVRHEYNATFSFVPPDSTRIELKKEDSAETLLMLYLPRDAHPEEKDNCITGVMDMMFSVAKKKVRDYVTNITGAQPVLHPRPFLTPLPLDDLDVYFAYPKGVLRLPVDLYSYTFSSLSEQSCMRRVHCTLKLLLWV